MKKDGGDGSKVSEESSANCTLYDARRLRSKPLSSVCKESFLHSLSGKNELAHLLCSSLCSEKSGNICCLKIPVY